MAAPRRTQAERYLASLSEEPEERRCSGPCGLTLPKDNFARCAKLGRQRYCRACNALSMRRHRAKQRAEGAEQEGRLRELLAKYGG